MKAKVESCNNVFDYFLERLEEAKREGSVPISQDTSIYLASLLTERTRIAPDAANSPTLAEMHSKAAKAPPIEQARTYRELGDHALYVSGYFRESVTRKTVSISYYEEMGSAAYDRADTVFKRWFSDAFGPVFRELADRFRSCTQLLEQVRQTQDARPDPVTRLYLEWIETGSTETARRLRELGVIVPQTTVEV